jgi:hypothetical protein
MKQLANRAKCFMLGFCMAYSSAVMMEVICFSEMLVDFQWTTWHYIPDGRMLHDNDDDDTG